MSNEKAIIPVSVCNGHFDLVAMNGLLRTAWWETNKYNLDLESSSFGKVAIHSFCIFPLHNRGLLSGGGHPTEGLAVGRPRKNQCITVCPYQGTLYNKKWLLCPAGFYSHSHSRG